MALKNEDYSNFPTIPKSDKYGIAAMKIGDDITIKNKNSVQMSSTVCYFRKVYKRNYVLRKLEGGGCRIWRLPENENNPLRTGFQ